MMPIWLRRRLLVGATIVVAGFFGATPSALADPAGPTDYRTEVIGSEPEVAGYEIEVIGGDSFLLLTTDPGVMVEIVGYRGEPFLRFGADGIVEQNELSPSRWLSEDRYGESNIPSSADESADPEWHVVAEDGSYAWHDHRAHWMNTAQPPAKEPGDTVLEATIPIVVEGQPVSITVRSVLLESPSPFPCAFSLLIAAVGFSVLTRFERTTILIGISGVAAVATAVGLTAYLSVPAETGPRLAEWALPGVALVVSIAAIVFHRRGSNHLVVSTLIGFAGFELGWWVWTRSDVLTKSFIPTEAPQWFDRSITAIASVTAVAAALFAWTEIKRFRALGNPS